MIERQAVSWRRLARRHFLWLPLLPLIFTLVFGTIGGVKLYSSRMLARGGIDGSAQVLGHEIVTRRDRDGNATTRRLVTFRFQALSGETVTGTEAVSRAFYEGLEPGSRVAVRYMPDDPSVNALEPGTGLFETVFLGAALLALAVSALWAAVLARRKLSVLRAARHGEVREAAVTGHDATRVRVNGRTQYRMRWIDAAGQAGQSGLAALTDLPPLGAVVRVYIDPRTGRGWWDGDF